MAIWTPAFAQAGKYSAKVMRHMPTGIIQQGFVSSTPVSRTTPDPSLEVIAGTGLSVTVRAGEAFIKGTTSAYQGFYHFINTADITNIAVASNSSGNPRIDAVIARVKDDLEGDVADTTDAGSIEYLVGTATAGATEVNLTGAPTIPPSSMVLAYVRINSGAATPTLITDRRTNAYGAQGYMHTTSLQTLSNAVSGTFTVVPGLVSAYNTPLSGAGGAGYSGNMVHVWVDGNLSVVGNSAAGDDLTYEFAINPSDVGLAYDDNSIKVTGHFAAAGNSILPMSFRAAITPVIGSTMLRYDWYPNLYYRKLSPADTTKSMNISDMSVSWKEIVRGQSAAGVI